MLMWISCTPFSQRGKRFVDHVFSTFETYQDGCYTLLKPRFPLPEDDKEIFQCVDEHAYGIVILNSTVRCWRIICDRQGEHFQHYRISRDGQGVYCVYDVIKRSAVFDEEGWRDGYSSSDFKKQEGINGFVDINGVFTNYPNCQFVYIGSRPGEALLFWRTNDLKTALRYIAVLRRGYEVPEVILVTSRWDILCTGMKNQEKMALSDQNGQSDDLQRGKGNDGNVWK